MYSRPFGARCLTSAPASPSASILASSLACFFFHSSVRRFLSHATGSCKRSFSSSTAAVFATRPAFIFCLSSQSLFSLSFLNRTGGGAGASPSSSDSCPDSSFGSSSSAPDPNRTFFCLLCSVELLLFLGTHQLVEVARSSKRRIDVSCPSLDDFSGANNYNWYTRTILPINRNLLYCANNLHAFDHLPEGSVSAIHHWATLESHHELTGVGVPSLVRH
mmetsp:Transcript_32552/g.74712  ORF Transcript_32552/g.74712 Transcript_32552/m.74712 type:complete len:219 (-) Transcript_32552:355-1011(-)